MRIEITPTLFSFRLMRYMAKEVLVSFFVGAGIFLLILLMFQAIRLSEFIVIHQVSLRNVLKLSIYMMLSFLPIAIPVAFLFSVLMGVSRANSEGEILALQAGGVSLFQIFTPLLLLSSLITGACLFSSLYLAPKGNRSVEYLITKVRNEKVISSIRTGFFVEGFYGLVLFVENIIPLRGEMRRVFLWDGREPKYPLFITAKSGILRNQDEKTLTLRLANGSIHMDTNDHEGPLQLIDFSVYDINLDLNLPWEGQVGFTPPSYTLSELNQRIEETAHDIPAHRWLLVDLHRRYSLSFSCIVFSALGFFIGILSSRGIRSTVVVLCLFIAVIYWLSYILANMLAISGVVPPWLGIWTPNFLFLAVAYLCYLRYQMA